MKKMQTEEIEAKSINGVAFRCGGSLFQINLNSYKQKRFIVNGNHE